MDTTYRVAQTLYFITFLLLGAGLTLGNIDMGFLTTFWFLIGLSVSKMFKTRPNPKKILIPSSLIILGSAGYLQLFG